MTEPASHERRGDLDALRAFAMLLGVALHASTSFYGAVWPVHDDRQSRLLPLLFAFVHGFRMPLFFLLSGFFTMLVLRRRGLAALVKQRALRIALPLALSVVTILPVCRWIEGIGLAGERRGALAEAVARHDVAAVRDLLAAGESPDTRDGTFRRTALAWAAMAGATEVAGVLHDAGADPDAADPAGATPLHMAALYGRPGVAAALLERGANPGATTVGGTRPIDSLARSPTLAASYGRMSGLPEEDVAGIAAGRPGVQALLDGAMAAPGGRVAPAGRLDRLARRYWTAIASSRFLVDPGDPASLHLFDTDVLSHLWFLWYLCWLVAAFAAAVWAGFAPTGRWRWWLVPATCVCQVFMEFPHGQLYGPDVAFGILPPPHLLAYYGCFFLFGAATYARDGAGSPLGRRWPWLLPVAILVLFPAGIAALADRTASTILQPAFAWTMSLGLIGVFHRFASAPRGWVSWLADASYFGYLAHLPVVIALQILVRHWPLAAVAKFGVVLATTTAILLLAYHVAVRPTVIGALLNGPRPARRPRVSAASGAR